MKEISTLTEKAEEKQRESSRLKDELDSSQTKFQELTGKFETHSESEKKQEEQISSLEEKYFKAYESVQKLKAENTELKKIAEKHKEMQQLLSGLGNVMDSPIGFSQPEKQTEKPKPKKFKKVESKKSSNEPNLFDLQNKKDSNFRQDFY